MDHALERNTQLLNCMQRLAVFTGRGGELRGGGLRGRAGECRVTHGRKLIISNSSSAKPHVVLLPLLPLLVATVAVATGSEWTNAFEQLREE